MHIVMYLALLVAAVQQGAVAEDSGLLARNLGRNLRRKGHTTPFPTSAPTEAPTAEYEYEYESTPAPTIHHAQLGQDCENAPCEHPYACSVASEKCYDPVACSQVCNARHGPSCKAVVKTSPGCACILVKNKCLNAP